MYLMLGPVVSGAGIEVVKVPPRSLDGERLRGKVRAHRLA
jgi:hypothetical protein